MRKVPNLLHPHDGDPLLGTCTKDAAYNQPHLHCIGPENSPALCVGTAL